MNVARAGPTRKANSDLVAREQVVSRPMVSLVPSGNMSAPRDVGARPASDLLQQDWATKGIAPMERPGRIARLFMGVVAFAERLNRKHAKLGNPCVFTTDDFPWATELEREWRSETP